MYVNTFEFYKIEKFKKHLDFNLLYNKIKEEIKEDPKTRTACLDWDNYIWIDKIIEFFSANPRLYLLEVYNIDIDVIISLQELLLHYLYSIVYIYDLY